MLKAVSSGTFFYKMYVRMAFFFIKCMYEWHFFIKFMITYFPEED